MALAIGDLPGLLLGFLPSVQSAGSLPLCAPKRCPPELQLGYRMRIGRRDEGAWSGHPRNQRVSMMQRISQDISLGLSLNAAAPCTQRPLCGAPSCR